MSVVDELDKSLFEGYAKPKATAVTALLRAGILDPKMDWYETPQPKGTVAFSRPYQDQQRGISPHWRYSRKPFFFLKDVKLPEVQRSC